MLIGGSIEQAILPTAVECALNCRPTFVAKDAIFSRNFEIWGRTEQAVRNSLISNYANMLTTKEIIDVR